MDTMDLNAMFGANLLAWYDASDSSTISKVGSGVTAWRDKSQNAHHMTQPTAYNQPGKGTDPTFSKPALIFSGDQFVDGRASQTFDDINSSALTVVSVCSFDLGAVYWLSSSRSQDDDEVIFGDPNGEFILWHQFGNAAPSVPSPFPGGTQSIFIADLRPDGIDIWGANGDNDPTYWTSVMSALVSTNFDPHYQFILTIGAVNNNHYKSQLNGSVSEIAIIRGTIPANTREILRKLLQNKWFDIPYIDNGGGGASPRRIIKERQKRHAIFDNRAMLHAVLSSVEL